MTMKLTVLDIGKTSYHEAYKIQKNIFKKRKNDEITDTLILTEHHPIITIGKSGSKKNLLLSEEYLLAKGIEVKEIDRGGNVTYHGPGQIVGYPILDLKNHKKNLRWLLRSYEKVFMDLLESEYKIKAKRISSHPGVWINNNKITAIGIKVSRWITFHGFAFNVKPQMEHFNYIVPCGIKGKGVVSLREIVGCKASLNIDHIKDLIVKYFLEVFNMEAVK